MCLTVCEDPHSVYVHVLQYIMDGIDMFTKRNIFADKKTIRVVRNLLYYAINENLQYM